MKTVRLNVYSIILHSYIVIGSNPLIAIAVLPYLVPDSRCKPELGKILQLAYVGLHQYFSTF